MLDTGFNKFVSPKVLSAARVLTLVLVGMGTVVYVLFGLYMATSGASSPLRVAVGLGVLIGAVVFVLVVRLFLETAAVLFRIAESARQIAENTRLGGTPQQPWRTEPEGHVYGGVQP